MAVSELTHKTDHIPTVSVIIPTHNRAERVCQAIDSVLAQEYTDFEIIVVDDGSVDDTIAQLSVYQDKIRVHTQGNKGVSAARNAGISLAKGDLIAFLDSDDLWLPKKLSVQTDFFNHHKEAMICQTEEIWIRNGRRVNPKKRHQKPSGMIYAPSLKLCLVSPSAVMIKKAMFDIVGYFDASLPACEDYDLWLRISCQFPIYLIDDPQIIKQGGHDDQLSKMPGLDKFRIRALQKMIKSGLLNEDLLIKTIKALKEKCGIYANGCKKRGRFSEARAYLNMADHISAEHTLSTMRR